MSRPYGHHGALRAVPGRQAYNDVYLNQWIQPDFIIQDPYNPQALNRYAFCLNNPLRYTDPTGHFAQAAVIPAAAALGPVGWVAIGALTVYGVGEVFVWGANAEGNREALANAWNGVVDSAKTVVGGGTQSGNEKQGATSGGNQGDPGDPLKAFRDAGMTGAALNEVRDALQNPSFGPDKALGALQQFQEKGIRVWGHLLENMQNRGISSQKIIDVFDHRKDMARFEDSVTGRIIIWDRRGDLALIVDKATGEIVTALDRARAQTS